MGKISKKISFAIGAIPCCELTDYALLDH